MPNLLQDLLLFEECRELTGKCQRTRPSIQCAVCSFVSSTQNSFVKYDDATHDIFGEKNLVLKYGIRVDDEGGPLED